MTTRAAGLPKEGARAALDSVAALLRNPTALHPARVDSLAVGHPGVSLLFATLAAGGQDEARRIAHAHLAAAIRPPGGLRASGLYAGAAAVAFAARLAATGPDAYRSLLDAVTPGVAEAAVSRARALRTGRARGAGAPSHLYDVVAGVTGLTRLLLAVDPQGPALRECLETLVDLTQPAAPTAHGALPGWWAPDGPGPQGPNPAFPHGHLNLGLAHGIPGPLALLALAHEQGVRVPGHDAAIERVAHWLTGWAYENAYGTYWPMSVRAEDELSGERPPHPPTRAAWCYGTPGVARALFLAGRALGEERWQELAAGSLRAALARPAHTWALEGTGLCHGTGGLLHIAARMAYDAGDGELAVQLPLLAAQVADGLGEAAQGAGFLEGQAGAALALHTYAQGGPSDPELLTWEAALLLG
ncbi:lanthionine synthetase C family protein [Streptomyces sp. NPDC048416]|uniref:lanthionine synthetase C family protein n=1 Tax=Streptomyces sp. NPDC048416 TaxID=3365546 RepID=UPI00371C1FB2